MPSVHAEPTTPVPQDSGALLEWLVVGGGPHGVHAAVRLIEQGGVSREAIRILDDEQHLLGRWRRSTRNTGMEFLRSPSVHHIDVSSASLDRFAGGRGRKIRTAFTRPYARPALALFDLHCDDVIERHGIEGLHVRGRANRLTLDERAVCVRFEDPVSGEIDELVAERVVLALGAPREPNWPEWARPAGRALDATRRRKGRPRIQHLFDPGFELADDGRDVSIVVVGAGISGAHAALRLARAGRRVVLVSRHRLRVEQFDSDPGWQGPKHMAAFQRIADPDERRERIRSARHPGSMPPDVHGALRGAVADGRIELIENADVESAHVTSCSVSLDLGGRVLRADRVLLATGHPSLRPGGAWIDEVAERYGLPCAACGYPVVDAGLRWHPRLIVTGALAELELGPVARNLSGARRAGDRIVAVARAGAPRAGEE